jgi:hypothetical protein
LRPYVESLLFWATVALVIYTTFYLPSDSSTLGPDGHRALGAGDSV